MPLLLPPNSIEKYLAHIPANSEELKREAARHLRQVVVMFEREKTRRELIDKAANYRKPTATPSDYAKSWRRINAACQDLMSIFGSSSDGIASACEELKVDILMNELDYDLFDRFLKLCCGVAIVAKRQKERWEEQVAVGTKQDMPLNNLLRGLIYIWQTTTGKKAAGDDFVKFVKLLAGDLHQPLPSENASLKKQILRLRRKMEKETQ